MITFAVNNKVKIVSSSCMHIFTSLSIRVTVILVFLVNVAYDQNMLS